MTYKFTLSPYEVMLGSSKDVDELIKKVSSDNEAMMKDLKALRCVFLKNELKLKEKSEEDIKRIVEIFLSDIKEIAGGINPNDSLVFNSNGGVINVKFK